MDALKTKYLDRKGVKFFHKNFDVPRKRLAETIIFYSTVFSFSGKFRHLSCMIPLLTVGFVTYNQFYFRLRKRRWNSKFEKKSKENVSRHANVPRVQKITNVKLKIAQCRDR